MNLTADSPDYDGQPAFSPDGTLIAFQSDRDGGGLFAMRTDGSGLRRLSASGYHPAWSPDGRSLAYNTLRIFGPTRRDRVSEIWIVDFAGVPAGAGVGGRAPPTIATVTGAMTFGSVITFTQAGWPLANARSSAGRISPGSTTYSEWQPKSAAARS